MRKLLKGCRHVCRKQRVLVLIFALMLLTGPVACTSQSGVSKEGATSARSLTIEPERILTLTAWPTAPLLLTAPPTPSPAPRPLWTAAPTPTASAQPVTSTPPSPSATGNAVPIQLGAGAPPVRLRIPSIEIDVAVVGVSWDVVYGEDGWQSVWQTADGAAGHHRNSANPGEAGNVVISGHHNTRGQVFREVSEIGQPGAGFGVGDEIILETQADQEHIYEVVRWERVQEEGISVEERRQHASYLAPTSEPLLTLVTCWPYDGNTHRVIVVAELQR